MLPRFVFTPTDWRSWRQRRRLRRELGREPTFGDIFADHLGRPGHGPVFDDALEKVLADVELPPLPNDEARSKRRSS